MRYILAVDDQAPILRLMSLVLEQEGFLVLTASGGADAMREWRAHNGEIGLLITDIVMPDMDGRFLAAELLAEDPNLRVLYISGDFDGSELATGERCAFLSKPFAIEALLSQVRGLLAADECHAPVG